VSALYPYVSPTLSKKHATVGKTTSVKNEHLLIAGHCRKQKTKIKSYMKKKCVSTLSLRLSPSVKETSYFRENHEHKHSHEQLYTCIKP